MARLGTKTELAALAEAIVVCGVCRESSLVSQLESLYAKLTARSAAAPKAAMGDIEQALVESAGGRVAAAKGGPAFWAALTKRYGAMSATAEEAAIVGHWIRKQPWLAGRVFTVDTLIRWWPNYLARARVAAEQVSEEPQGTWARPEFEGK